MKINCIKLELRSEVHRSVDFFFHRGLPKFIKMMLAISCQYIDELIIQLPAANAFVSFITMSTVSPMTEYHGCVRGEVAPVIPAIAFVLFTC